MYFTDHDFTERTQIMVWMTSINYFSTLATLAEIILTHTINQVQIDMIDNLYYF